VVGLGVDDPVGGDGDNGDDNGINTALFPGFVKTLVNGVDAFECSLPPGDCFPHLISRIVTSGIHPEDRTSPDDHGDRLLSVATLIGDGLNISFILWTNSKPFLVEPITSVQRFNVLVAEGYLILPAQAITDEGNDMGQPPADDQAGGSHVLDANPTGESLCHICNNGDANGLCYECSNIVHSHCSQITGQYSCICYKCKPSDECPDPFVIARVDDETIPSMFTGEVFSGVCSGLHPFHRGDGANSDTKHYGILCDAVGLPKRIFWLHSPNDVNWVVETVNTSCLDDLTTTGHVSLLNSRATDWFFFNAQVTGSEKGVPANLKIKAKEPIKILVASLSDAPEHREYFKSREAVASPDDIEKPLQDHGPIKKEYPDWFQPFANDASTHFEITTKAFGKMTFTLMVFPRDNLSIIHTKQNSRRFFVEEHCQEPIKGYCVFGMYVNTRLKMAFPAYTLLVPLDTFRVDDDILRIGPVIYVRAYLTQCLNPRVDHAVYCVTTKRIQIWRCHVMLNMYTANPAEDLGVSVKEIDDALAHYYYSHNMIYKPQEDGLKM